MFKINKKPMILHVIENLKYSKFRNQILVATSNSKSDNDLVRYLKSINVDFHRGNLVNVAKRLFDGAKKRGRKYFIRISADSPLIDSKILDKMISIFKKEKFKNYDIITNVFPKTFPKGYSIEIIKTSTIGKNLKFMNLSEKEHVTKFFYKNHEKFKIKNVMNFNRKKYRLNRTVDKKKDLKIINKILNEIG